MGYPLLKKLGDTCPPSPAPRQVHLLSSKMFSHWTFVSDDLITFDRNSGQYTDTFNLMLWWMVSS
jgi:hypothetical protein